MIRDKDGMEKHYVSILQKTLDIYRGKLLQTKCKHMQRSSRYFFKQGVSVKKGRNITISTALYEVFQENLPWPDDI